MTKAELVGVEFGIAMAFYPGKTYSWYWSQIDKFFQVPWQDVSVGWAMVPKQMVNGSGVRWELAR